MNCLGEKLEILHNSLLNDGKWEYNVIFSNFSMLGHLLWRHNIPLFGQKGGKLTHQFLAIYADEKLKTLHLGDI